jgi:hypothetical protein
MWNPRRIFLALMGLMVFFGTYFIYTRILGGYDGLPVLPERFRMGQGESIVVPIQNNGISANDRYLQKAFGANCVEQAYDFKFFMREKRILMATRETPTVIKDGPRTGWLKMTPLSIAVFGKNKGPDGMDEISTLYADIAYVQFDKPIRSLNELDGRQILAAELHSDAEALSRDRRKGRIHIVNNRKTYEAHDDVEMVTIGPIFYVEHPKPGEPNIHTTEVVQITDYLNDRFPPPENRIPTTPSDPRDPREPTVTGTGLRIFLAESAPKDKAPKKGEPAAIAKAKPKAKEGKGNVGGIERVELQSNNSFNLWTDPSASLVAPSSGKPNPKDGKLPLPREVGKEGPKAIAKGDPKKVDPKDVPIIEKKLLMIKTNGRFIYDMQKEIAHFEKPAVSKPGLVEQVTVTRAGRTVGNDQLVCDFLDVYFQRKQAVPNKGGAPVPAKKDESVEGDMEVSKIHAWGESIALTSDSENLDAYGKELIHMSAEKKTILRGNAQKQMYAVKDGNLIRGVEMTMLGSDDGMSSAEVLGPGSVGMGELNLKTNEYPKQAYWGDKLVYSKINDKGKIIDLLTFTGKAEQGKAKFVDLGEAVGESKGQVQEIEANQLKVWLIPPSDEKDRKEPKKLEAKKPGEKKDDPSKSAKPARVEATGDVRSTSPDMQIKRSDYLNVHFKDVLKLIKEPEPKQKADPKPAESGKVDPGKVDPKRIEPFDPPKKAEPKKADPKPPMTIVAKTLETWVNRDPEGKVELDRLHAEGDVEVHQDPSADNEQGTHINGRTMDLKAYAEGNYLVVTGEEATKKYGVVQFDKITMYGFDIVIDTRSHTSTIKGEGSMDMLSATDLEGKKLDKPTMITVWWFHKMEFFGADKQIHYHGRVQALQQDKQPDQVVTKQMKGEWMQVIFDRPLYLNESSRQKDKDGKPKDSPQIDVVLCFHEPKDDAVPKPREPRPVVCIEKVEENGRLMKVQTIQTPELSVENKAGKNAVGGSRFIATSSETMPGLVRIFSPGKIENEKEAAPAPKGVGGLPPKNAPPVRKKGELAADEEMKLTVVQFAGKMIGEDKRKQVKFFKDVKVVHLPTKDPNLDVQLRQAVIPEGAFYIDCRDTLEITTVTRVVKDDKGKDVEISYNDMKATTAVHFRKQGEFHGESDMMTYSEEKGVIIFYGRKGNPAVVNQVQGQGVRDKTLTGERIRYDMKTKGFEVDKASSFGQ